MFLLPRDLPVWRFLQAQDPLACAENTGEEEKHTIMLCKNVYLLRNSSLCPTIPPMQNGKGSASYVIPDKYFFFLQWKYEFRSAAFPLSNPKNQRFSFFSTNHVKQYAQQSNETLPQNDLSLLVASITLALAEGAAPQHWHMVSLEKPQLHHGCSEGPIGCHKVDDTVRMRVSSVPETCEYVPFSGYVISIQKMCYIILGFFLYVSVCVYTQVPGAGETFKQTLDGMVYFLIVI